MRARPFVMVLLAFVIVLLAACGGDSKDGASLLSKSGAQVYDTKKAEEQAHAAMLLPGDLPGSDWKATNDEFDDDVPANVAACADIAKLEKETNAVRVARATRELARPAAAGQLPLSVESVLYIYPDADGLAAFYKRFKANQTSPNFIPCFEAALKDKWGSNVRFTVKSVSPKGNAVNSGSSYALELTVTSPQVLNLYLESHAWVTGNGAHELNFTGPKDLVTPELIKTAQDKFQAAAQAAAQGKR